MSIRAIDVKPLKNYELEVIFENGEIKKFDVKPYLQYKAFQKIKNIEMFNTVKIGGLSIEWADGTDICPDELYNNSYKNGEKNKMNTVILETDRLILRNWKMDDINDLQEGLNDIEVTKWKGYDSYPYTLEDAKNEIEAILKKYENENYYNWAIVLKSENKVIGRVGLYDIYDDVAHGGGIWINRKYWNMGYATEAMKKRTEFAFEELNLRKIENSFFEGNEASWKLQEKLGYKIEGIKRQAICCKADGIIKNECITGLLRDEWKK